jgi:hypothetical protein
VEGRRIDGRAESVRRRVPQPRGRKRRFTPRALQDLCGKGPLRLCQILAFCRRGSRLRHRGTVRNPNSRRGSRCDLKPCTVCPRAGADGLAKAWVANVADAVPALPHTPLTLTASGGSSGDPGSLGCGSPPRGRRDSRQRHVPCHTVVSFLFCPGTGAIQLGGAAGLSAGLGLHPIASRT